MEIKLVQKSVLEVWEKDVLVTQTIVGNDLPLGKMHDASMLLKGWTVDRMVTVQRQEEEISSAQRKQSEDSADNECCASE